MPYDVIDFCVIKNTWFLLYRGFFVIFLSSSSESIETKQRLWPFSVNIRLTDSVVFRKSNGTKSEILVLFLWLMTHMTKQLYFKFYVDIFGKLMSIKMQKEVRTLLVMDEQQNYLNVNDAIWHHWVKLSIFPWKIWSQCTVFWCFITFKNGIMSDLSVL